ncbi:PIN domain-containing protein [Methylobacterium sp. M6A4_1b]
MFVDASALVAIPASEVGSDDLLDRLETAPDRFTSAIAVYEAVLAPCRKRPCSTRVALADLTAFLNATGIRSIEIPPEAGVPAAAAFARYGRGTGHTAQRNRGDGFADAMAKVHSAPLLFEGDDFARTDLAGTC